VFEDCFLQKKFAQSLYVKGFRSGSSPKNRLQRRNLLKK
jgi:hypothetical protein